MPTVTQTEVEQFIASLRYDRDEREPPDDERRAYFLSGWNDYTKRNREYSEQTLAGLTWQNLGFRFAKRFGEQPKEEIRRVYHLIALRMIDMAKGSLQTGMAYWTIGGENDTEVEIRYRKTHSTFYFELELKDPVNGVWRIDHAPLGGRALRLLRGVIVHEPTSKRPWISSTRIQLNYPTGVRWDPERRCLYSEVPRKLSHADWYRIIRSAVRNEYGEALVLTERTTWDGVPPDVRTNIQQAEDGSAA